MKFNVIVHITGLLLCIFSYVNAISIRESPIGSLNDRLMHAAVMDSDMKYVLTWTPRENDIVFQIEVNNPTSIQENIHIIYNL